MKSIVFDSGPIISLTTNNLLWLLESLKGKFKGDFIITEAVKKELIERPLETKRFKFEALQVLNYVNSGVLKIYQEDLIHKKTLELLELANTCFRAKGNFMRIVHFAEISSIAACLMLNADAMVVDERTTRQLIESPERLIKILNRRLHTKIEVNRDNLARFRKETKNVKLIRSSELVAIAYELGLLNKYLPKISDPKRTLLESVLWGVKLNGCAISEREINEILRLEVK